MPIKAFPDSIKLSLSQKNITRLQDALWISTFTLLTALLAQIKVPLFFTPVPMTLQTLAVVGSGAFLGWRRGSISQIFYIVLGAAGAPFFAGSTGALAIFGPTGGYLFGFVFSSFLAGILTQTFQIKKSFTTLWLSLFLASIPCLGLGMIWLKYWMQLSWAQAFVMGISPFIFGDLIKTTLLTLGVYKIKP